MKGMAFRPSMINVRLKYRFRYLKGVYDGKILALNNSMESLCK